MALIIKIKVKATEYVSVIHVVAPAGIVNLLQQIDLQLKTEVMKIKLT